MKRFFFLLVTILVLVSCQHQKVVTVTEYRDRQVHDTIACVDSVWNDRWHTEYIIKGTTTDTLVVRDSVFRYKTKYQDKIVERISVDSIPYTVEVEKVVRRRNGYDKFVSWGFWILFVLIVGTIAWRVYKAVYLKK